MLALELPDSEGVGREGGGGGRVAWKEGGVGFARVWHQPKGSGNRNSHPVPQDQEG